MKSKISFFVIVFFYCLTLASVNAIEERENAQNLITDYAPINKDGTINVVIEIPAGTNEKWEVTEPEGKLELKYKKGKPRVIKYLGYPGNYGMVPRTLMSGETGGDNDPLDVLAIGAPITRGKVVKAKLIGVLKFLDVGERDDKLIVVLPETAFYNVDNFEQLDETFPGITSIIKTWFLYYKGSGKMVFRGFGSSQEAKEILNIAVQEYRKQQE